MKNLFKALLMNITMFTKIPIKSYIWDENAIKYMMILYPLIGLLVGCFWYISSIILQKVINNIVLLSSLILLTPYIITGFIHLDGFMDVCDAILSRRKKEEKIKILKDANVGAFSVISLFFLMIIEFSSIISINYIVNPVFLIFVCVVSRTMSAYFMTTKNSIEESYYANLFKEKKVSFSKTTILLIYILTIIISLFIDIKISIMSLIIGLISLFLANKCCKELGGYNGDVAGYILVTSEFVGILTFSII